MLSITSLSTPYRSVIRSFGSSRFIFDSRSKSTKPATLSSSCAALPIILSSSQTRYFSTVDKDEEKGPLKVKYPGLYKAILEKKALKHELSFAWITPRSLAKGLEGPICARLMSSCPELMLVGARVIRPSHAFVDEYIEAHMQTHKPKPFMPFIEFLNRELRPNPKADYPNALLMLLFTGPNCREKLINIIGSRSHQNQVVTMETSGDQPTTRVGASKTIRGSFGGVRQVRNSLHGTTTLVDFEPAIVSAHSDEANEKYLKIISKYANVDGGSLVRVDKLKSGDNSIGMVMIKPDSLAHPTARIGHIMDLFSSTGLVLIGASVFSLTYNQAKEFYGHLEPIFEKKLASQVDKILRERLGPQSGAFSFKIDEEFYKQAVNFLKKDHAQTEVGKIIEYMSGISLEQSRKMTEADKNKRGTARCFALLYQGPNAIETIRNKLGATNPEVAQYGTVRGEFGVDVMRNTAHASDSFENLVRECKIIKFGIGGKSIIKKIVDLWYEP